MRSQMQNANKSSPPSTGKPGLARGVTKDNLTSKAKLFTEVGSGEWQSVGKSSDLTNGENRMKEFGAWVAYFQSLGMTTRWYEGRETVTVPARWPHMFDAERDVQTDYAAAGTWANRIEMERRSELERPELSPEQRAKVLARIKARWWPSAKTTKDTPPDHLSEPQGGSVTGIDIDELVAAHDRDLAAYRARKSADATNERNGI